MWRFALMTLAAGMAVAQELPKADPSDALEIEPPLLIKDGKPIGSATNGSATPGANAKELAAAVERARKSASGAERQFRAGIISKAQAEERALRVARLQAEFAQAQLREAEEGYAGAKQRRESGEISLTQLDELAEALAHAREVAQAAEVNRARAEIEFARNNVQRQQKLLALGSGRKADVERAQAKLTELTTSKN